MNWIFNIECEVNQEFMNCVKTVAVEGGINYWALIRKIQRTADLDVTEFEVCDNEEDSGEDVNWLPVTDETIVEGISSIINGAVEINEQIVQYILQAIRENDCGHIDADAADCIVQVGLFGEIVFG